MGTSRLIVKNLPNSATDVKVRELFSSRGIVTDVQLKYTPDGHFRHFCFVGYKTSEEAENAREYFNNTYFGASKIQVEACASLGDTNKPRAWSKYAAERRQKQQRSEKSESDGEHEPKSKKKKKEEEILDKCKEDPTFVEFLESHIKKSTWGNDTLIEDLESQIIGKKKKQKSLNEDVADNSGSQEDLNIKADGKIEDNNKSNKKKQEKGKKVLPDKEYFTLKLRNLPEKARKKDLKGFFSPLKLKSIRLPPQFRGIAYIGFATEPEMNKALYKNKGFLLGNQISVRKYESTKHVEQQAERKKNRWAEQQAELERETETVGESGRIFIRNLCYETKEEDIKNLFEKFGPVTEVHLPIDKITRQLKGFGFISFLLPEHAAKAFAELDGTIVHGRMLHLLPSKSKEDISLDSIHAGSSYKKAQELQRKKTAGLTHNWNTLFLGQNAVAEVISDKYNVSKEEMLLDNTDERNKNAGSVAVRMALAETEIISETKEFLENNGVYLGAFEGNKAKAPRSTTCLLVKNLPPKTSAQELDELFAKHGMISRIILPPSGITAIVEFIEPAEARASFKKLAYSKFKNIPLYLEWAPLNIFDPNQADSKEKEGDDNKKVHTATGQLDSIDAVNDADVKSSALNEESSNNKKDVETEKKIDYDMIPDPDTTLFVKNLNFSTTEGPLKKHFEESGPVYSVSIARKRDPKQPGNMLSMGYGFVQFFRAQDASTALKNQQNSMLENHFVELKRSNRTLQAADGPRKLASQSSDHASTKILVRNVPFQASKEELLQLFKTFGELKAIRLPLKMDGSGEHRGFVFIEFYTKQEAQRAFETLSKSTHLYGRRLVLEWAAQDDTVDELRVKTAKKFDLQTKGAMESAKPKAKKMMRYFEETQLASKKKQDESSEDEN